MSDAPVILPLDGAAVSAAAALEAECFPDALSADAFAAFVRADANHYYAALDADGNLTGYGGFCTAADEAEILTVAVAPHARRRGIARALMRCMLRHACAYGAETVFLEVRASNEAARALYRSLGFTQTGIRKNYYARPKEDAVLMALRLSGTEDRNADTRN